MSAAAYRQMVTIEVEVLVTGDHKAFDQTDREDLEDQITSYVTASLSPRLLAAATQIRCRRLPGEGRYFHPGEQITTEGNLPLRVSIETLKGIK